MESLAPGDPRQVGPFLLHFRLGAGGMGRVFLGFSPAGRAVAVKVVHPRLARDPEFVRRFRQEVAAARAVGGAYTAPVVAAGPDDDPPWLATAFVAGPSLAEAVAEAGPLPAGAVWRLAGGLVEALQAVHACGLVHRDLKPANVLLAADGPRVIDFGISRALAGTAATASSMIVGTPAFMSPEQAESLPAGPASDVFALGSVIAFALTGNAPFGGGHPAAVAYQIVHAQPDLSGIPGPLRDLVDSCLAKDPAARPPLARLADAITAGSASHLRAPSTLFWPEPVAGLISAHQDRLRADMPPAANPEPVSAAAPARHEPTSPVMAEPGQPDAEATSTAPRQPGWLAAGNQPAPAVPGGRSRRAAAWRVPLLAGAAGLAVTGVVIALIANAAPSGSTGTPGAGISHGASTSPGTGASRGPGQSSSAPASPSAVIASIPVAAGPTFAAVDSSLHRLYVTSQGNYGDTVSVIDTQTDQVVATLTVGVGPAGIVVDPRSHNVYVAGYGAGGSGTAVSVINGNTDQVTGTVTVGNAPRGIAIDPVTNLVYVTDSASNAVSVINAATNKVAGTVTVGQDPGSVAVDPVTDTIYVTNANDGTVSVIDGKTGRVTHLITVGNGPGVVAVDPATGTVLTANTSDSTVSVIDGRTGKVTATLAVGAAPDGLAVDAPTAVLYVANNQDGTMSLINLRTGTVSGVISVGSGPAGMAIDPSTHRVYVTSDTGPDDGTVHVVSGS